MACSTTKAVEWDEAWSNNLDPSGRAALGVHLSAYGKQVQVQALSSSPEISPSEIIEESNPAMKAGPSGLAIKS